MLKPDTIVQLNPKELKFVEGNRRTDDKHVSRLKAAIAEENLIHINPIKVNTNYQIIDGQHRTRAALELGLKQVSCLIVKATVHDAQLLNQNSKNWSSMDFANYWMLQGKESYKEFIEYVHTTGLAPSICIEILGSLDGRHMVNFRKGSFKIRSTEYCYRFFDRLEGFKGLLPGNQWTKRSFVRAFWVVFNNKTIAYNHERMLKKAAMVGLRPTVSFENYMEQFEHVYNYKVRASDVVKFK